MPKTVPLRNVAVLSLLLLGAFWTGDALHGRVYNPFVPKTQQLDFSSLNSLYGVLQRNYDGEIPREKVLDAARKGLVEATGDPYTTYLTAEEAKEFSNDLNGKLSGIGAEIGLRNNIVTVIAPIDGSPAKAAGLQAGDAIIEINGESTEGMSVDGAVRKIRGPKDTKVKLTLARNGTQGPVNLEITRADIVVPSVKSSMKDGDVAYIQVSRFASDTGALVKQAARELKAQGAKKVVLDLRNNGGGYLQAAQEVSSEFLPEGKLVVAEKSGGEVREELKSAGGGELVGMPTIVLINGGSASASEITAGALRDHGAAKLLGEKSFGKGSVQEIKDLHDGAQLKVTVARWFTPKGSNIDKEGIKPGIEVKMTPEDVNADRDPQLERALAELK